MSKKLKRNKCFCHLIGAVFELVDFLFVCFIQFITSSMGDEGKMCFSLDMRMDDELLLRDSEVKIICK